MLISLILFSFSLSAEIAPADIARLVAVNNSAVQLAKLDLDLAKAEQLASNKDEDWNFGGALFYENSNVDMNSSLDREKVNEKTLGLSAGLTKELKYGTNLDLSYQTLNIKSNSLNAISDRRNQGTLKISLKQPLLKGRAPEGNIDKKMKAPHKIKRYEARLNNTLEEEVNSALRDAIEIYKEKEKIKIKSASLPYYESLVAYNKKSLRLGKVSKADFLDSEAKLKRERALVIQAESKILELKYKLLKKIISEKDQIEEYLEKLDDLNLNALKVIKGETKRVLSPKILEKRYRIKEDSVDLKARENNLLPRLDLNLAFSSSGIKREYFDSLSQELGAEFPEFEIGLSFNWSFGNNDSEGRVQMSQSQLNRTHYEALKIEQKEKRDWREVLSDIKEIEELNKLRAERKKNEEEKLRVKKRMYRRGMLSYLDLGKVLLDYERFQIELLNGEIDLLKANQKLLLYSRRITQF